MQKTASSLSTLWKTKATALDQARNSFLFRLPLEIRLEIYSYLFTKTILHVEAVHPYLIQEESLMVCPELEKLLRDEAQPGAYDVKPTGDVVMLNDCQALPKSIGRFMEIESSATWSRLFRLYQCTSTKSFEVTSACPPSYCDHVDCGKLKTGPEHAFQRTCRQAYVETADLAHDATSHTALQFAELRDLMAFSMMLTNDQREDIRHIRVNLDFPPRASPEWHYFCNVFATPWDRRSIQHLFEDSDYSNHKAEISFYYNYSSRGRLGHDSGPTFASPSWVKPNVRFGWKFRNNSWSTEIDLSLLRARTSLSVRFAIPQFLFRTKDLEIDINDESMWDDEREQTLYPGDEGHVRLAERYLTENDAMDHLLALKGKILGSVKVEEKEEFQEAYDIKFHHYWHEPDFCKPRWGPGWLRPLQQCQHFESFEIDFYDENGPRSTMGLEILRDGLKERFTSLGIGPHPFLRYT